MELERLVGRGNSADIYEWRGMAIKWFHPGVWPGQAEWEAAKQRSARACGVRVPEILEVTEIGGRPALVMEYVQGESLGELLESGRETAVRLLEESVALQMEMHRKRPRDLEPMNEKLARQIETAPLNGAYKESLLEKLNGLAGKQRLCHGDFHLYNIIRTESGAVIIDWIDATAGDPGADACRTYLLCLQYSGELAERYLELYCNRSGLSKEEIARWLPVVAAARLTENVPLEHRRKLEEIVSRSGC